MSAVLSHKYKFIYPHVPRTGGTSLTELIEPHLGEKDITDGQLEKHQALRTFKLGHPIEFDKYIKFIVVRHPFDRLASLHQGYTPSYSLPVTVDMLYSGAISKSEAFYWPIQRWVCDVNENPLYDKVFKLEDGFKGLVDFLQELGLPIKIEDLPHINKGTVNHGHQEYYSKMREDCGEETMRKIKELYAWDYEAFGYD